MTGVLTRRGHRDPCRRRQCDDGGGGQCDASVSQEMLRIAGSHQELGTHKEASSPGLSEEAWP